MPEGSRIDISATANLPIKVAYIELLQAQSSAPDNDDFKVEEVEMQFEGTNASGHFVAVLNSKRTKPRFSHYRIRFCSVDGFRNERPNVYPIQVIADLGPEIEIVTPKDKEMTLPVNQPLAVEVRAADLDFEISSVDLQLDHQGTKLLDRKLPMDIRGNVGDNDVNDKQHVTARMVIKPDDLNLEPGDRVIMSASAADNRVSTNNSMPDPNIAYTDNYTLIITDPIKNPKQTEQAEKNPNVDSPQRDDQPENKQPQDKGSDQNADTDNPAQDERSDGQHGKSSDQPTPDEGTEGQSSDGKSGSEGSESDNNNDSTQSNESASKGDPGDSQQQDDPNSSGNSGDSPDGDTAEQSGNQKQGRSQQQNDGKESKSQTANNENRVSNASGDGQSNASEANEKSGGSNQSGTQDDSMESQSSSGASQSEGGQQQDGVSKNRQQSDTNSGGQNRDSQADTGEGQRDDSLGDGQQEPLRKDAPEGEQFDKLKDYLEKQGKNASDQKTDDTNNDPQEVQKDPGDQDEGANQQNSQGSRGDDPNSNQLQEAQPGKGNSGNEKSKDGNPQDGQPDGGQSQSGQPDRRQTGDGDTNAQNQSQDGQGGLDQQPSDQGQPADSKNSPNNNKDSRDPTGNQSQSSTDQGDTNRKVTPRTTNQTRPKPRIRPAASRQQVILSKDSPRLLTNRRNRLATTIRTAKRSSPTRRSNNHRVARIKTPNQPSRHNRNPTAGNSTRHRNHKHPLIRMNKHHTTLAATHKGSVDPAAPPPVAVAMATLTR